MGYRTAKLAGIAPVLMAGLVFVVPNGVRAANQVTFTSRDPQGTATRLWRIQAQAGAAPESLNAALDAIASFPGNHYGPITVSPDGGWYLFFSERFDAQASPSQGGYAALTIARADLSSAETIKVAGQAIHGDNNYMAQATAGGTAVVYVDGGGPHSRDLYLVRRQGAAWGAPLLLTGGSPYAFNSWPVLAPDGQTVVFNAGDQPYGVAGTRIGEVKLDGTGFRVRVAPDAVTTATPASQYCSFPGPAPDGSVVFETIWGGAEQIWRLPAIVGPPVRVNAAYTNDNSPNILPGGQIVSLLDTGTHQLKLMDAAGGNVIALTQSGTPASFIEVADIGVGAGPLVGGTVPTGPGALQFSPAAAAAKVSSGSVSLTVSRTGGSAGTVSVGYATVDGTALAGTDYTAASGALTWGDGDSADKSFAVSLLARPGPAADKLFTVALSGPTGGAALGAAATAAITVMNDLVAPTRPAITSPLIASASVGAPFSYTITASGSTPIAFSTSALPADMTRIGATITGTPGGARVDRISLTATNAAGADTRTLVLTVTTAPPVLHPRLWVRAEDLPRLRSWAVATNPIYQSGLAALAASAKADMDAGRLQDSGGVEDVTYPSEMYAELFAYMSLLSVDPAARDDYAGRARTLLMGVMNVAALGQADGMPFRQPNFATTDRSRWHGEGFPLTVDWIYPYLTAADKATIRRVFLRWVAEDLNAATTDNNHPVPIGVLNDPALIADPIRVRWSSNNYFTAHARNIGLMAMALDPADDPADQPAPFPTLRSLLGDATGAWLYMLDNLMRNDARGGLFPEGFEYSPQSAGYVAQLLLALRTAGQDDPGVGGPQAALAGNPFWDDAVPAFLHSLSPVSAVHPALSYLGPLYAPAWYGACQNYWSPDFIQVFGPLGIYDEIAGNSGRLAALRWIETETPPGGPAGVDFRARDSNFMQDAIFYFMLFDPAAAGPADPRAALPLTHFAPGIGRLLARTGWGPGASWFDYSLGWNSIDHQGANGNNFEFYRAGEWLTKGRNGYDLDYLASDNFNTLCLQNDPPFNNVGYRNMLWQRGSQWLYVAGDPRILARSDGDGFVYALGDSTNLYNSVSENSTDIVHASRSILWLKPDQILLYDRATSKTANRFKRLWFHFPAPPVVTGNGAAMTTTAGQRLYVTSLLPAGGAFTVEPEPVEPSGNPANEEPMKFRMSIGAPGDPQSARFLTVLQGADPGAPADPVTLITSGAGTAFAGAWVRGNAVLFPVDLTAPFTSLTYTIPAGTVSHRITGLTPDAGYTATIGVSGANVQVTVTPGGTERADAGGVLVLGPAAAPLLGDLNGDGVVTATDLNDALQIYLGTRIATPAELAAADVRPRPGTGGRRYGDGRVGTDDLNWIFRRFLGLETQP